MKIAKFNVAIAELLDVPTPESHNPFVTIARFVFADDKPNGNKQGIKVEEFPNIIKTAIGMPVKMNFVGETVANHAGSVPVGHITKMEHVEEADRNVLHAEAMLWNDEFPEEIEWLKRAHAEKKAPNLSYELEYKEDVVENGIQWKKDTTTLGATFVHTAAYGSRTHLIALASLENDDERNTEIVALAEKIKADQEPVVNSDDEGGNSVDELEKANAEIKRLTDELAARDAKISDLETAVTTATDEKNTVMAELDTLKSEAKIDGRVRQYTDAGFALETDETKANARKAVFASFDDAQWETYLADLKASKPKDDKKTVLASLRTPEIPKPEIHEEDFVGLRDEMRGLARPHEVN